MAERITFFGFTDYSLASLELIIRDLQEGYLSVAIDSIKRLEELKGETKRNSDRLRDANSVVDYIEYCITLFQGFAYDFKRILNEMPSGVENKHLDIIKQIYERSRDEKEESYREFKKEHIERDLRDESLRPLLDEIFKISGNAMTYNRNLWDLGKRLTTFVGCRINIEERKSRTPIIVPFPAPPGITWDRIEIRFLSNKAVKLIQTH
jgi:hypothetical protein